MQQISLKPGSFIVFEGLDATGKSTQLQRIQEAAEGRFGAALFGERPPLFTHQPSGNDALGEEIYAITEKYKTELSPWTRQYLHLASHAHHYESQIIPELLSHGSVFMDRCWWSTVAYGLFGGLLASHVDPADFIKVAQYPTQGYMPDVVFAFTDPWVEDGHNTVEVAMGYQWLIDNIFGIDIVKVPQADVEETTMFIFHKLTELGYTE